MPQLPAGEVGMSVDATNEALLTFLGIPPNVPVAQVEITVTPDDYPRVILTLLLTDPPGTAESRLFYLVPYSEKP